jgi:hypothetical protein
MLPIPSEELLQLLNNRGYTISIEEIGDSKFVTFLSTSSSTGHRLSHSYSLDWDNYLIEKDVVGDLLAWTGLKVKYTLDY